MDKDVPYRVTKDPISLLLVEGKTDELFYKRIKTDFLTGCRSTIRDLKGLYNINAKVIESIADYSEKHEDEKIRVYCCLDRDSRYGEVPGFDLNKIKKYIKDERIKNVLSVALITATQQIESWFFYDIGGIHKFLRISGAQRNSNAFKPPEKFGYKDLQRLFEQHGRTYTKGEKAANFIDNLDVRKIAANCKELHDGIELILSQAGDLTNHLFPTKRRRS